MRLFKLVDNFIAKSNNRPHRILLPKLTIFGLRSSDYSDTDQFKLRLKNAILEKTSSLKHYTDEGKTFDILFIKEDFRRKL